MRSPSLRVLVALAIGLALGMLVAGPAGGSTSTLVAVADVIGTLWTNAIRMTVIPLVTALTIASVAETGATADLRRAMGRAIAVFVVLLVAGGVLAAVIGEVAFANFVLPADVAARVRETAAPTGSTPTLPSLGQRIIEMIPSNPVKAAADGALLPLVVFALALGFGLKRIAADRREAVIAVFARGDVVTHPQYHLKLLLARMGIARGEVAAWHRSGPSAAPPARSRAISNLFLPPEASTIWAELPAEARRLAGVRIMETAHPEEEAQAIAVLVRRSLAVPEKRVAVITPDRDLAQRLVAHLERWGIAADDTAGRALPQTPAGRLFLQLAEVAATSAAPVPLLALLGHPLVQTGEARAAWLERVRQLDLALRGPRPGPGLEAVRGSVAAKEEAYPGLTEWWDGAAILLAPLIGDGDPQPLGAALGALAEAAEALCGTRVWAEADGRALAGFVEAWRGAAEGSTLPVDPADLPALLRDATSEIAVRPPYGSHPRLAIYGLLEARMSRADLVICGGMTEGNWPAAPSPDPLLAPPVLRALGIPGADFRIGLAAHDLAAALGAPEVVLSHAARDAAGPVIPSRFLLRIRAMLGRELNHEDEAVRIARLLDDAPPAPAYPQPEPMPSAEQRRVAISSTALDRLRGDPYQFYAQAIMGLRALDALDADATAAWRGTAVHEVLRLWHDAGSPRGGLIPIAERALAEMSAHPFMRGLWRPRLIEGLKWVEDHHAELAMKGRVPALWKRPARSMCWVCGCMGGLTGLIAAPMARSRWWTTRPASRLPGGWCRKALRCSLALSR